jgi:hypothetical protein
LDGTKNNPEFKSKSACENSKGNFTARIVPNKKEYKMHLWD